MSDPYRKPKTQVALDCHTHLFPEKLFVAIRRWFSNVGWQIPYPYKTEAVLADLKAFGVEEIWALTYAHRAGVAEEVNAWLGDLCRRESMVHGFFSVHSEDEDPHAIALRALDLHGLEGLKLHCEVQNLAVDDRRLDRMFSMLEQRRIPSLFHCGDAPYPYTKPNLDVARLAERLKRNPSLVTVIAHLGANQTVEYLKLTEHYDHLYLEVSFTNFPGMEQKLPIDYQALAPYAERLLFGSDFPNLTFSYADQVDAWWELDWVKQDAENFFGRRARKLLAAVRQA